jgi:aspartate/methionine/tyrosine aminotransferase
VTLTTNTDLAQLATSGIRRFTALANQTPGCVKLTLGEPEFDTPEPIRAAVGESLARGLTHYPPNNGRTELLEALSSYMGAQWLAYAPEEIIVTCGATEALSATLMSLLDPGDEVIVPVPAFGLYETIVRAAHGVFVPVDTSKNGFQLSAEALEDALSERTKAIVITSPNNPTGCVYDAGSLDAVAELASSHDLYVVCDDVYNRLCYDVGYERFAVRHPELRDQTVVVDSFSKPWAMTGWRLGWLAAAPVLKAEIQKMHQYLVSSVPAFVQDAAVVALGLDISDMQRTYESRRDVVCDRLTRMGLALNRPSGAFYAFPSIAELGMGSEEFCERAIREAGVALVPGTCFGSEGFVRLSYCVSDSDLELGLSRFESFVEGIRK